MHIKYILVFCDKIINIKKGVNMKAHADLKNLLKGKKIQAFVKDMCLHAYPWTEKIPTQYLEYKIFEEFRLRQDTGEKTRLGLDKSYR